MATTTVTWRSWSGDVEARPGRTARPASTAAVLVAVRDARATGTPLRMVGSGHSFTGAAQVPDGGTLLLPHRLTGLVEVDRAAMTVTVRAGTRLRDLNAALERLGLSLHNMGDVAVQTVAGAVSTGTHGAGGRMAGLAAQVVGLTLVTGTGEVLGATPEQHREVWELGRVSLGALGVVTELTLAVEPLFLLRAEERPTTWDAALGSLDEVVAAHDHVDLYWFPHTDRVLVKTNDRVADAPGARAPLPPWRAALDDELLSNRVFGAVTAGLARVPAATPTAARLMSRALSGRTYTDVAHRVFTSERDVRFRETEWAVPREVAVEALREARAVMERGGWPVSFPVEVRPVPADDVPQSSSYARDAVHLAFHVHRAVDGGDYFREVSAVMRSFGGRPHWGKLHDLGHEELAALHPRLGDLVALRDRLDPDRVLANDYTRRVLGD